MSEELRRLYVTIGLINKVTAPIKELNKQIDAAKRKFEEDTRAIRDSLRDIGLALSALGYGGFRFFRGATKDLADFQDALRVFRNYAGENAEAILKAMEEAADGTIDSTQMILNANKAMVMGIDPQFLPEMMRIARAAARAMGADVSYMFESIAIGTARQSKLILDNLGIIVDAEAAYKKYAESIGKTAKQLTEAEKRQAFLMAVMESGRKLAKQVDLSQESLNETIAKARVAWTEFKRTLAEGALPVITSLINSLKQAIQWLKELPAPIKATLGTLGILTTIVAGTLGPLALFGASLFYIKGQLVGVSLMSKLALRSLGPIGLAITGITAAFYLLKKAYEANFLGFRDRLQELWRMAKAIFGALKVVFSAFWETVKDTFTPVTQMLRDFGLIGDEAGKGIRGALQPLIDFIKRHEDTFRTLGKILGWLATGPIRVLILAIYLLVKALEKLMQIASEVKAKIEPIMKIGSYLMPGIGGVKLARGLAAGGLVPSPRELIASTTTVTRTTTVNQRKVEIKPGAVVIRGGKRSRESSGFSHKEDTETPRI